MGDPGVSQPAEDFTILHSSMYETARGRGSYLMTGEEIVMTTGPKRGERYVRITENFLRKLDAVGQQTSLRCARRVQNNQ